ncbi:MAG: SPOR domain-containing protein, partial [Thermoanaerobaculia bacterium]
MKLLPALLVLSLISGCARRLPPPATRVPPAPQPAPPAPAEPAPPQTAPPVEQPPAEPEIPEAGLAEPVLIRVGLASDLEAVTIPCCEEPLTAAVGDQALTVTGPLRIEPAAAAAQAGYYRIQAAALRDERQAQDLAQRLQKETGQPGDSNFDADIDLYRVRVGRYPTREDAEKELRRLATIGVTGAFIVNEGSGVSEPAVRVTLGSLSAVHPGRWVSVAPVGNPSVRVQGKRYRGRILVYLNDRGMLNLINELPVEDYLRGVVPSEMGPEQYNQVEA